MLVCIYVFGWLALQSQFAFFSLSHYYLFFLFFLVECSHSFVFAFFPEMTVETSAGEKGE